MATNLPSCFFIQFLEQLLKFLVNFTLLKHVKSQRSYGFFIPKELIFGFQILDLKDHFSASSIKKLERFSLKTLIYVVLFLLQQNRVVMAAKFVVYAIINALIFDVPGAPAKVFIPFQFILNVRGNLDYWIYRSV